MGGDHDRVLGRPVHAEDLAKLAAGAEDELDLALVEAQRLDQARQWDRRRGGESGELTGLDRPGRRRRSLSDEFGGGLRGGRHAGEISALYSQAMQANSRAGSGI